MTKLVKLLSIAIAMTVVIAGSAVAQGLGGARQLEMTDPVYDAMSGAKMGISGFFTRNIPGMDRTAKLYVAEDTHLGAYMVVLNTPENVDTGEWLVDSGWVAKADAEKFIIYVLEPGEDGWGGADDERAYFAAAYGNIAQNAPHGRAIYYLPPESFYVVGYGAPGALLQELVMKDPTLVAAAAFVDASDIAAKYLDEMATTVFPTPDWNGADVAVSAVPMPVMLISADAGNDAVVDYWKAANQVEAQGEDFEGGDIFRQDPAALEYYVAAGSRTAVAVLDNFDVAIDWVASTDVIFDDFLSDYTRYGGNVGGNTVGSRPNYEALGVEYKSMELDGKLREYLVYAPQSIKDEEAAPLVLALHGSGMTMYAMFDYSRWWEVADREGFILVVPMGFNIANRTGWDVTPDGDDIAFIEALVDKVVADYSVDETRMYVSGQSNGSRMTHAVGQDPELSRKFAAMGSTSGRAVESDTSEPVVPYHLIWGEFDSWPWEMTGENVGFTLNYWLERNQATTAATEPQADATEGRFRTFGWANGDGQEVVRYTVTMGRGHSIIPAEMDILWDWFSSWKKNAEGVSTFVGNADDS